MDNFFIHMFKKREAVPTSTTPTDDTRSASYDENVVYAGNQSTALKIATFYRCLELRANTMAQLRCMYRRRDREGGNFVEDNWGDHGKLNYLLQVRPNPLMNSFEMWRQIEIEIVLRGNAFVYIERDSLNGWPRALWLAFNGGYDAINNVYTLVYNAVGGPRTIEAESRDVLHFANTFRFQGGHLGISTLSFAKDTLSMAATLDKSSLETAAKGGRFKMLIGEEKASTVGGVLAGGLYNKNQMDKYAAELEKKVHNADVIAMRGIDKTQIMNMTAADMQLFEQRQFGVAEICRLMSVPRSLVMDGSNSSYKTPEADRLDFLMNCIQPKRRYMEDELNSKLLTPEDFDKREIHLCELPLMMFDKKGQAEIDKLNLETGAKSVNEIRRQYDMPAVPNGDKIYISTNLAELGSKKLSDNGAGRPTETPVPPTPQPEEEGGEQ